MPGIVQGEIASCSNPLLPFFYQEEGRLKDVFALRFEVFKTDSVALLASGTVDLLPCTSGGHRVGLGHYVADLDTGAAALSVGSHDIVWHFTAVSGGVEKKAVYSFEVLDPTKFRAGAGYVSYLPSNDPAVASYPVAVVQQATSRASREVERLTGRFFFPKRMELLHTVRPESSIIWLDQPIIGIEGLIAEASNVISATLTQTEIDMGNVEIFNRHLSHLLSPDDRDNPKIGFGRSDRLATDLVEPSLFPRGLKNIRAIGVFGYTDPDGSPFGMVPEPLKDVISVLAYRRVVDPSGTNISVQDPSRVRKAKTRDQEIQFSSVSGSSQSWGGSLTGDQRLDDILVNYMRPYHVGSAG